MISASFLNHLAAEGFPELLEVSVLVLRHLAVEGLPEVLVASA